MTEALWFDSVRIAFDERVLRPRPWTARQSAWAADLMANAPEGPVLELCAGAGHIGLLAVLDTTRRLVAVDANPAACEFTRKNAAEAGLADRIDVRCARIDEALDPAERFAVIIADPPWVPTAGIGRFPHDPASAIDGGTDGLEIAWACVRAIENHLAPGGYAVLQLGTSAQAAVVARKLLLESAGLRVVEEREEPGRGVLLRIDKEDVWV